MYWVNSVLWQLRIGKSLRNSLLFQGLVFGLIFRSCKDYFFSFLLTRLLFHRNVIGFQFSAKKIFAKCNCFDNCQTMFLFIEIVFIDLNAIIQNQQGTKKPIKSIYFHWSIIFVYLWKKEVSATKKFTIFCWFFSCFKTFPRWH